jgi:hypothetical protein
MSALAKAVTNRLSSSVTTYVSPDGYMVVCEGNIGYVMGPGGSSYHAVNLSEAAIASVRPSSYRGRHREPQA